MDEEKFENNFERVMQILAETQKLASSLGLAEQKDPKTYLEMGEELCNIRHNFNVKKEIYKAAAKEKTLEGYDQALHKGLSMPQKAFDPKNTIEYKKLEAAMVPDEEEVDSDVVVKVGLNKFDPITKKQMVNPVKSIICGHHYEKESIMAMLKNRENAQKICKCPVAGCINNNLQLNELEDDPDFKAQIQSDEDED
ncbi:uncharacterized protein LOC119687527 [Teleopsis dalmanni]|uniref:uncharacterized protein LOC119687527 n=1 Tax=Teleopsis dalmanni TaxID=139649 RepID=UPI0018CD0157|nr:uncharacterized protein LOC119687527 [Teleopsis dalmanni]